MPDGITSRPDRAIPEPGRLRRLDARIKLPALVAACFVTQYLPDMFLPLWLALLFSLFLVREMRVKSVRGMARGALSFTIFWLVMKTGSDVFGGMRLQEAVAGSLPLAGRLAALSCIGMAFVGLSSPVETGRAIAWYLTPLAGKHAWKPALAVALTSWFLPVTLRLAGTVSESIRARGLRLPWHRKAPLIIGTSLRILEHKAEELAAGLGSRRVDDYRTWK